MVNDPGQVVAPVAPDVPVAPVAPVAPAITPAPISYVGVDGNFIDNWQTHLTDTSLHDDKTLGTLKNVENLAKSYVHVRKQVPMDKVAIPTETSGPEIYDAFYKAGGRPDTADYVYEPPEDISSEDLSPEFTKAAFGRLHAKGASQAVVTEMMAIYTDHLREVEKAVDAAEEQEKAECLTALRNKWGAGYDERIHLANRMVADNCNTVEMQDYIIDRIGNDPVIGDFLANMASKFKESRIITDVDTPSADTDAKIKELMNSDAYQNGKHPNHEAVTNQVYILRQQQVARRAKGTTI